MIDIAATVLDAAGLPHPTFVHGVQQMPLHGKSMLPSFADAEAPEHRETQYFEMFVNRGIYHKGWTAATRHSVPWVVGTELPALDDDVWELYEPDDWTQSNDRLCREPREAARAAAAVPDRGGPLRGAAARRSPRRALRTAMAGRPMLVKGNSQILYGGMKRIQKTR